eukprot:4323316-Lingulodinium_polyedra.AAC.1
MRRANRRRTLTGASASASPSERGSSCRRCGRPSPSCDGRGPARALGWSCPAGRSVAWGVVYQ